MKKEKNLIGSYLLLIIVIAIHVVECALQAGLGRGGPAHHAVHRRKLFLVPGKQCVHAGLQLGEVLFVAGGLGVGVVGGGLQGAAHT